MKSQFTIGQEQVGLSASHPVHVSDLTVTRVAAHNHTYHEVAFVWSGRGAHLTEAGETTLSSGSVLVVPPETCHAFADGHDLTLTNLYYLSEWLLLDLPALWKEAGLVPLFLASSLFRKGASLRPQTLRLTAEEQVLVKREMAQLAAELRSPQPSSVFTRATLLKLFVLLARAWRQDFASPLHAADREVWALVYGVEQALLRGRRPNFADIAREVGYSQDHMSRLFREATGFSAEGFYQHRRVQHACKRLLDPDVSITDIAHELGYADASHFVRHFKVRRGVTPSRYRKTFCG